MVAAALLPPSHAALQSLTHQTSQLGWTVASLGWGFWPLVLMNVPEIIQVNCFLLILLNYRRA